MSLGAVGNVTYSGVLNPYYNGVLHLPFGRRRRHADADQHECCRCRPCGLIVSGNGTPAGTVVLLSDNDFAFGTTVTNATLQLASIACMGTGTTTVNGATINLVTGSSNGGVANPLFVVGPSFLNLIGADREYVGAITGSTTLALNIPATRTLTIGGSLQGFYGTFDFGNSAGAMRFYSSPGGSNATFNLGTNSASINERDRNTTVYFGAISGAGTNTS